jgi:DNA-binding MarR family transcriptional regulator
MAINPLELGRSVKRLQNLNHRRLETALREIDTTLAQWDALRAIDANPGASGHALAEETFQTDQSFGTLATRMIANGLLERQQGAGRALVHTLTSKGREVLEQGQHIAEQVIGITFEGITEAEQVKLFSLLRKLLAGLGTEKS